ncbi:MAG: 5-methylcytosine-specific restriction endonuclease system specificity protein McrC [Lachnospiraceae bacterium]|nr:5-methylcytosine-specific restriction endonuclease system specificity protein McrC [Lachnospiraceae bacterium]
MTIDKGIYIKNIFYMLSYAFQVLKQDTYKDVEVEEFENVEDMFAAILSTGLSRQIKQGLYREYAIKEDNTSSPHGKIVMSGTIKNYQQKRRLIDCEYDELSVDNLYNQILKTTIWYLIRQENVKKKRKDLLKQQLILFDGIKIISNLDIRWDALRFTKNNQEYRMLLNICYFVFNGLVLTTEKGSKKVVSYIDEQKMHALYEKFILGYYRYHYPDLNANPDCISWATDDGIVSYLPNMITDITLKKNGKVLIIDAKYYGSMMASNYDVVTYRSANLYQIFSYVKNWDRDSTGNVSGMLLYAKTSETVQPNMTYQMNGNTISVKTLDLNCPFSYLAETLNKIVEERFNL